jgi:hypothetical protein
MCQRAKTAQNTQVGFHSATPLSRPLETIFIDFVGQLLRTRTGNQAILFVSGGFSKFVAFFPLRNINSKAVGDARERRYFPAHGTPESVVSDNAKVFRSRSFSDLCFKWEIKRINITSYYRINITSYYP